MLSASKAHFRSAHMCVTRGSPVRTVCPDLLETCCRGSFASAFGKVFQEAGGCCGQDNGPLPRSFLLETSEPSAEEPEGGWAVCVEEGDSLADTSFGVAGACGGPFCLVAPSPHRAPLHGWPGRLALGRDQVSPAQTKAPHLTVGSADPSSEVSSCGLCACLGSGRDMPSPLPDGKTKVRSWGQAVSHRAPGQFAPCAQGQRLSSRNSVTPPTPFQMALTSKPWWFGGAEPLLNIHQPACQMS